MSNPLLTDTGHMRRALRLAEKGSVSPNPMVGAVIVKEGQRVGEGFHEEFGGNHAEIQAIKSAECDLNGASLFVTLEPCTHYGKTPPCVDEIVKSGIKKVIIAAIDPFEKNNGKGVELLKKAGIEVNVGLLKDEAEKLNEQFYTFHKKKRPFISLKAAISLDGKIAKIRGERTYLTGKKAKKQTDILRSKHQSILVGSGTVLSDNPKLSFTEINCGKEPLRIILGDQKKLNKDLNIFRNDNYLIIEKTSINEVMNELYKRNIISVIVEGGHEIFSAFINEKIVDRFYFYISPVFLGENGLDFAKIQSEISLKNEFVQKLGDDIFLSFTPNDF